MRKLEPPGAIDARAERRVHDEVRVAGLVEEALEDHALRRRQHAERRLRRAEVVDELLRCALAEPELVDEPAQRALGAAAVEQLGERLVQPADGRRQLVAAARRFAEPKRNRRRLAVRIRDVDLARLDLLDAIRRVAELEHVAGHALEREVLVQRADRQLARQQHDFVVELIGNGAAVGDGRERGAAPAAQHVVDAVEVQVRAAPAALRREAVGDHARDADELVERRDRGSSRRA